MIDKEREEVCVSFVFDDTSVTRGKERKGKDHFICFDQHRP
jgi:hypothetical protein